MWAIKTPGLPWSPSNWLPNTASESQINLHSACLKVSSSFKHCRAFQVCVVTPFIAHERDSERPKSQGTLSSLLYSVCLFALPQHKQQPRQSQRSPLLLRPDFLERAFNFWVATSLVFELVQPRFFPCFPPLDTYHTFSVFPYLFVGVDSGSGWERAKYAHVPGEWLISCTEFTLEENAPLILFLQTINRHFRMLPGLQRILDIDLIWGERLLPWSWSSSSIVHSKSANFSLPSDM